MSEQNRSIQGRQGESLNAQLEFCDDENYVVCILSGTWSIESNTGTEVRKKWQSFFNDNPTIQIFRFQIDDQIVWDSTLISFLHKCRNFCVLNGQDTPHNLCNCHVYTQGVVEACEFNANSA